MPASTRKGLEVSQEDCDLSIRSDMLSTPEPPSPNPGSRVYVQQGKDNSRFRPLQASRVRRQTASARSSSTHRGSAGGRNSQQHGGEALSPHRHGSFADDIHEEARHPSTNSSDTHDVRIDPDFIYLHPAMPADRLLGELLVNRAQCEANASVIFFWCQALLVGVGVAAAAMVLGSEEDALGQALSIFRPGLGRIVTILSEVVVVGSAWQFADLLSSSVGDNRVSSGGDMLSFSAAVDGSGGSRVDRGHSNQSLDKGTHFAGDREGQSPLFRRRMISGFRLAFNLALLLSCLAGSGRADVVLNYGPWTNGGTWPSTLARRCISAWLPLSVAALVLTPWPRPTLPDRSLLLSTPAMKHQLQQQQQLQQLQQLQLQGQFPLQTPLGSSPRSPRSPGRQGLESGGDTVAARRSTRLALPTTSSQHRE